MPFHDWSDKDFDWKSLYTAEEEIRKILKFGRVGCHSKEKYGTLRWSIYLTNGTLHSVTHPGYVYSQYPKWLWKLDITYKPLKLIAPIIRFWQRLIIEYAFHKTCTKYPHIVKEIVCDMPDNFLPIYLERLKNSMWTRY